MKVIKILFYILWLLIFCYPHGLLYPLSERSIRLDDIYIIIFSFLTIILNLKDSINIYKQSFLIRSFLILFVLLTVANISGLIYYGNTVFGNLVLRTILKNLSILFLLHLIIYYTYIYNWKVIISTLIFGLAAGLFIVLISKFNQEIALIFAMPIKVQEITDLGVNDGIFRAFGPFGSANIAGGVGVLTFVFFLPMLTTNDDSKFKIKVILLLILAIGSIILSQSRGATLALLLILFFVYFTKISRLKLLSQTIIILFVVYVIISIIDNSLLLFYAERFNGIIIGGKLNDTNALSRYNLFIEYIKGHNLYTILYGLGEIISAKVLSKHQFMPHNAFLNILNNGTLYVSFLIFFLYKFSNYILLINGSIKTSYKSIFLGIFLLGLTMDSFTNNYIYIQFWIFMAFCESSYLKESYFK